MCGIHLSGHDLLFPPASGAGLAYSNPAENLEHLLKIDKANFSIESDNIQKPNFWLRLNTTCLTYKKNA